MSSVKFNLLIVLHLLSLVTGQGQNGTIANGASSPQQGKQYTGWQPGAPTRGTINVLWTCLSTIFACSWTILHLNIPPNEHCLQAFWCKHCLQAFWCKHCLQAFWCKTKWMIATILFPEFIFSKAVAELQMAVDDLHDMTEKVPKPGEKCPKLGENGSNGGWEVSIGWWASKLCELFHLFEGNICRPPKNAQCDICHQASERSQSKTESNAVEENGPTAESHPSPNRFELLHDQRLWTLTHSYFANMGGLSREEPGGEITPITAHALVKCCIGTDHDPLPGLYISEANIKDKSKADILVKILAAWQILWLIITITIRAARGMPIAQIEICTVAFSVLAVGTYLVTFTKPKDVKKPIRFKVHVENLQCNAGTYFGNSYFNLLYHPLDYSKQSPPKFRIPNDFVRLERRVPPMTVALAISTVVFGGLHCIAWKFGFPTKAELMIWMIASVLSATLPLFGLLVNILILRLIDRGLKKSSDRFKEKWPNVRIPLGEAAIKLTSQKEWSELRKAFDAFVCHGTNHEDFFEKFHKLQPHINKHVREARRTIDEHSTINADLGEKDYYLVSLCDHLSFVTDEELILADLVRRCNLVSRMIMATIFLLYICIRLLLLILALIALRKAPAGIYITTWTRNLPSIS